MVSGAIIGLIARFALFRLPNINCYEGAGATSVNDSESVGLSIFATDVPSCIEACQRSSTCTALVVPSSARLLRHSARDSQQAERFNCMATMRQDVNVDNCISDYRYELINHIHRSSGEQEHSIGSIADHEARIAALEAEVRQLRHEAGGAARADLSTRSALGKYTAHVITSYDSAWHSVQMVAWASLIQTFEFSARHLVLHVWTQAAEREAASRAVGVLQAHAASAMRCVHDRPPCLAVDLKVVEANLTEHPMHRALSKARGTDLTKQAGSRKNHLSATWDDLILARKRVTAPHNTFHHFGVANLFPEVEVAMSLDTDTMTVADVGAYIESCERLLSRPPGTDKVGSAVAYVAMRHASSGSLNVTRRSDNVVRDAHKYVKHYTNGTGQTCAGGVPLIATGQLMGGGMFKTGVMVMNLRLWRESGFTFRCMQSLQSKMNRAKSSLQRDQGVPTPPNPPPRHPRPTTPTLDAVLCAACARACVCVCVTYGAHSQLV